MEMEEGKGKVKSTEEMFKSSNKIKILCLHGYRQNGDTFKSKIGSFRKSFNRYAEFVFVTAPHCASPKDGAEIVQDQRSWWSNKDDGTFKGTNKNGPAFGFKESLKLVEEAWKTQGPFQGLLGFSQGACFVGIICGLARKNLTTIKPNFAIICSGFVSGSLVHKNFYEDSITIPSLHIYGTTDDLIPAHMSEELVSHFKNAQIVTHSGGHYFPTTGKQKQVYLNFIQDRLEEFIDNTELTHPYSPTNNISTENDARGTEVCDQ